MAAVILGIGALVFLAHVFAILFQRTRIPDVLLLIAIGLLLGPVTGVVTHESLGEVGRVMSTVALVVILFESGTTLDLAVLGRAMLPTSRLTFATFGASLVLVTLTGWLVLDLGPVPSLLLGATLAGTSSAVVIPIVRGLRVGERTATVLILESALTDVLCIVLVFALLAAGAAGEVSPFRILGSVLAAMLFAAGLGVAGGVAWLRVLPLVRRVPNTLFASVAFVFLVYGVAELLGYSGAIAALAFGVTLENHRQMGIDRLTGMRLETLTTMTPFELQFFAEVVFILRTFFFVYLGTAIAVGDLAVIVAAVVVVVLVYGARLGLTVVTVGRDTPRREAGITSAMVPKGLAAAVLAGLPAQQGVVGGDVIQAVVFTVVLASIAATALLVWAMERPPLDGWYAVVLRRFPPGNGDGAAADGSAPSQPTA